MSVHWATTTGNDTSYATAWNGPICQTCGKRYVDSHACSTEDIVRRINELLGLLDKRPTPLAFERLPHYPDVLGIEDRTAACPCRKENGGSGVCGCVLGGPQVTC